MSHHISGPRAMAEPAADVTDLYAFPSPEHPGRLVLVLNTLPFALPTAAFSDGLIYRFRLRPLIADARDDVTPFSVVGGEIEVDCAILGHAELYGVVGETLTRGRLNIRLERAGRPEVPNLMLAPKQFDPVNRDLEIRDLYNMDDAFHLSHAYRSAYRARLNANLAFWDGLDGKTDWPAREDGAHPLTELMLADYLVVDITKPYAEHGSFLEIELAARRGEAHRTCGGRTLNDDVMDTIFTLLVNAGNGPIIRDGIDQATRPGSRAFPYLAPPNPDPPEAPRHV